MHFHERFYSLIIAFTSDKDVYSAFITGYWTFYSLDVDLHATVFMLTGVWIFVLTWEFGHGHQMN